MSAAENFLDQLIRSIPSDFLKGLPEDVLSDIQENRVYTMLILKSHIY